jgi:NADH-quinone oxidoreductase subunit H
MWAEILWAVGKIVFFILLFVLNLSAVLTWMERRQSAMMQDRMGPVRARVPFLKFLAGGRLFGLMHPIADALKLLMKEDFRPPHAYRAVYVLAPILALLPVLMVFAVIPFGPPVCLDQLGGVVTSTATCNPKNVQFLQIANIDIGLLFVFAIASLSVYGAALAGWASNNNYALLGGLRASAQMLSYEITMGMAVMGVFLVYGTLEPMALVQKQGASFLQWGIIQQPLAFILFFFAAIAETKRAPFDIPEGESEIVGYFVEYSGTRFMVFYLGEFLEIVFVGTLMTTLFLGGWQIPGLVDQGFTSFFGFAVDWKLDHWMVTVLRVFSFSIKVFIVCFLQLAIRWTLPRMRYDQLMALGWKGMLPASILNVVITAGIVLAMQGPK